MAVQLYVGPIYAADKRCGCPPEVYAGDGDRILDPVNIGGIGAAGPRIGETTVGKTLIYRLTPAEIA